MTEGLEAASGDDSIDETDLRTVLGTYAELVRLPNLFTAPPDVILGAALVAAAGYEPAPTVVAGLSFGSVLLYAGGTTLNDAFDAPIDASERPERPIPSDRVSRGSAFAVGFGTLVVAVVTALVISGWSGATVAGLLAIAIVSYDGVLKETMAGYLTMGATRGLNVVLGTTAAGSAVLELSATRLAVPAIVVVYIAAVTFMAARETGGGTKSVVAVAAGSVVASLLVFGWYLLDVQPSLLQTATGIALAGAFCWWVGRPLRAAYADPAPETIGPAIGACVLGLVLLDAAFAAVTGVGWAVVTAVFLLPSIVLSRVFAVT